MECGREKAGYDQACLKGCAEGNRQFLDLAYFSFTFCFENKMGIFSLLYYLFLIKGVHNPFRTSVLLKK